MRTSPVTSCSWRSHVDYICPNPIAKDFTFCLCWSRGWCITTGSAHVLQSRCAICCRIRMRGVAPRLDWRAVRQFRVYSEEGPWHHTTECQLRACPSSGRTGDLIHMQRETGPQVLPESPGTPPQTTSLTAGASTGDLWTPTMPQIPSARNGHWQSQK